MTENAEPSVIHGEPSAGSPSIPQPEWGTITDEAVEILQGRVGVPSPSVVNGYHRASRDILLNWVRSTGDLNPLYRDPDYAATSRWGGLIGVPTVLQYMGDARGPKIAKNLRLDGLKGDPLKGVHGLHAGVELELLRPIAEGDGFHVTGGLGGAELKPSKMGGRAVHEKHDKVLWTENGDVAGMRRLNVVRVEHEEARSRGKHADLDVPRSYTAEDMEALDALYEAEEVRGSEPRYWEDVQVGDESVPLPKGPYTVTTFITQAMGIGLMLNQLFFVHSEAYRYRKKHPLAFPPNHLGIPDSVSNVHWELEAARRAGVPERYDAGAERVSALMHAVSNWMGDDAFLRRLSVQVRGFMFVGDVMIVTCRVTERFSRPEGVGVHLEIEGVNQRDETIARGQADVLLPSREQGAVRVPVTPTEPLSVFEEQGPIPSEVR